MTRYLIVFAVAAAVSTLTTPLIRRLAIRVGAVDIPDDRKVHIEPTPTMGGLAIYLALLAGLGTAYFMPSFREVFKTSSEAGGVLAGASIILVLGVVDDILGLKAPTKLAGQLLAVAALVFSGVQVFYFWVPKLGIISLSSDLSSLLTVLWTIAMINAVNLIDGLDGLAAGVSAIASAAFFAYAFRAAGGVPSTAALLTAIVAGGCLGFLRHNFNPAKIFMGDSGSMLLGLLLASATVSGVGRTTEPQFSDFAGYVVPVLLPVVVLAIPLADAMFAIFRRVRGRRPVFHADKRHIHHWLLEMARGHRQAVLVMYLWSAMLGGAALALTYGRGPVARWTGFTLGVAFVASVLVLPRFLRPRTWEATEPGALAEAPVAPGERTGAP
ncbi:MAG: glycosyltransferase family 4 protein [Actinomycetota bacterium]|nr:undecaprenyl/decaprenyl-phosphate alpha-N-acetylglucosaminyl 1-phosphate transferase [Actinomycetota bacterium]